MRVNQLPFLANPIPAALTAALTYSRPLRMACAGNGGCPDILTVTWPGKRSRRVAQVPASQEERLCK